MSDQKQPISGDEAFNTAKDYARDNPDTARSAIDKVEDLLDQKTGGKFSDMIDKGGDFVEGQLGIPTESTPPSAPPADPSAPPADPGSTPTTPTTPSSPSAPEQPSEVPVPNPAPGTGDPQPQQDPTAPSTAPDTTADPSFPPQDAEPQTQGGASPGEAGGLPEGGPTQQGDQGSATQPGGSQPADGGGTIDLGQEDGGTRQ